MIKHHPTDEILSQFVSADLPASLSVAVAIHVDMCPCCKSKVAAIEAKKAEQVFTDESINNFLAEEEFEGASDLLDAITMDESVDEIYEVKPQSININDQEYQLPRSLSRIPHSKFMQMGKLSRSRVALDDGSLRSSLLHIAADGEIPEHTHTGFELTLLLEGEFSDETGKYVPGDFMMLDGRHNHTPVTKEGCLCFTVVSSALHFNKGLSKLLNPIGNFIY
ncbi:ChrR family anti-sigma-E factor [Pseudoalteromonas atlantica]|uniref:ChrR family anti-sigma-E factor n=1 Tax=Pseudoalteromonas atlantica TaxID=288 RepID=UPI0037361C47